MTDDNLDPAAATLLRALADGALVVRGATILFANPRAASMFGYAEDTLVGKDLETLVPESERDTHAHVRAGYQDKPRARMMGARRGLMGRREDGSYFRVEISLSPIDVGGQAAVLALVRDPAVRDDDDDDRDDELSRDEEE